MPEKVGTVARGIKHFEGKANQDVRNYLRILKLHWGTYHWPEKKILDLAKLTLSDYPLQVVMEKDPQTFTDLSTLLLSKFDTSESYDSLIAKLFSTTQGSDSVQTYISSLNKIFIKLEKANYAMPPEILFTAFTTGLNPNLKLSLTISNITDYTAATKKCLELEVIQDHNDATPNSVILSVNSLLESSFKTLNDKIEAINQPQPPAIKPTNCVAQISSAPTQRLCFNCNSPDHVKRLCPRLQHPSKPYPYISCNYCHKPGHSIEQCHKRMKNAQYPNYQPPMARQNFHPFSQVRPQLYQNPQWNQSPYPQGQMPFNANQQLMPYPFQHNQNPYQQYPPMPILPPPNSNQNQHRNNYQNNGNNNRSTFNNSKN